MNTYYVWITAMFEAYADAIIAALVRRGYEVKGLADSGDPTHTRGSGCIIQLSIKGKIESATKLNESLRTILEDTKTLYYSLIIAAPTEASWIGGNITLPEPPPAPSKPIIALN